MSTVDGTNISGVKDRVNEHRVNVLQFKTRIYEYAQFLSA